MTWWMPGVPLADEGAFVKYERGVSFARGDAFMECIAGVPLAEHVGGRLRQIETFILFELHGVCVLFSFGSCTRSKAGTAGNVIRFPTTRKDIKKI